MPCEGEVVGAPGDSEKAVKTLIEHCNKFGEKTGRSGAEVFRDYLEWMKKHADYFFSCPWPPKYVPTGGTWLSSEEYRFIEESKSYEEEVERFTVVLLKRNLSLEGFKVECFDSEFDFYGRMSCEGCAVPGAMRLREYIKELEESNAWIEEKRKLEPNDPFWVRLYDHRFSPESIRSGRMAYVELEFMEVDGEAEGKVCEVRNKYLCPYGAKSWELVKLGNMVRYLWRLVEFYERHWGGPRTYTPSPSEAKWYHMGELGILDVTSRDDILKALGDDRMDKIANEFKRYNEEVEDN